MQLHLWEYHLLHEVTLHHRNLQLVAVHLPKLLNTTKKQNQKRNKAKVALIANKVLHKSLIVKILILNKTSNRQIINSKEHRLGLLNLKAKSTVNVVMIQTAPHSYQVKIMLPDLILMVLPMLGYKAK